MSSTGSAAPPKTVKKSTFWIVLTIMIVIMVILAILIPLEYINYTRTLGKLQNNICPVLHA